MICVSCPMANTGPVLGDSLTRMRNYRLYLIRAHKHRLDRIRRLYKACHIVAFQCSRRHKRTGTSVQSDSCGRRVSGFIGSHGKLFGTGRVLISRPLVVSEPSVRDETPDSPGTGCL